MAFAIDKDAHYARRQKQVFIQRDTRRSQYRENRGTLQQEDALSPVYVSYAADDSIAARILQDIPLHESTLDLCNRMYSRMLLEVQQGEDLSPAWLHHSELGMLIPLEVKTTEGRALRYVVMDALDILHNELSEKANMNLQKEFLPAHVMQYEDEGWFNNTFPDMH